MHLAGGWSLGYPESPCKEGAKELPEVLEHGGHGLCCEASQVRCLKGSSDYTFRRRVLPCCVTTRNTHMAVAMCSMLPESDTRMGDNTQDVA